MTDELILQGFGAFGVFALYVILGLIAWALLNWSIEAIERLRERLQAATRFRERVRVGQNLKSIAHWFSHDVGAWKALETAGERLQTHTDFRLDGDELRDVWRQKMQEVCAPRSLAWLPDKPTEEMLRAAKGWREVDERDDIADPEASMFDRAYRAMVTAAGRSGA